MPADYTLDGVSDSVEIGRGNARVKASGTSLQTRDSADTAFATMQGADPTVDDDLSTKRYVDEQLGALPSLDLYEAASGSSIGLSGAWAAVPMDTQRQIDTSEFTHSSPAADFTWAGASGTKVKVVGRFTVTSTSAQIVRGRITINTGTVFTEVTGSRSAEDLPASSEVTVEVWAILTLNTGDRVRIEGQGNAPLLAPTIIANSSGLQAFALVNAASGGSSGVVANEFQRKQVQTTLSLISTKGVATPTGFWDFNQRLTELTTGGSGRDLNMPGAAGNADAYSLVEGVPGGADEAYGLFLDSNSMAEVNNSSLWRIRSVDADLSISVWVRIDDFNSTGESQEQGIVSYVNRSSASIGTSTAPTYVLFFRPLSGSGGTYFSVRFGYWDNTGTPVFVGVNWEVPVTFRPIRVSPNQWVHVGVRRVTNGVNDVDSFLYINGELVGSTTGQNDTGTPTSANMRLICGARMSSADELLGTVRDLAIWNSDIGAGVTGIKGMYEIGVGS